MCRSNPQLTVANHLWALTSLAPELDPRRLCSSLMSNFRMADLHRLNGDVSRPSSKGWILAIPSIKHDETRPTYLVTGVASVNKTSFLRTLANVAFRLGPLKGVVANCAGSAHHRTNESLDDR